MNMSENGHGSWKFVSLVHITGLSTEPSLIPLISTTAWYNHRFYMHRCISFTNTVPTYSHHGSRPLISTTDSHHWSPPLISATDLPPLIPHHWSHTTDPHHWLPTTNPHHWSPPLIPSRRWRRNDRRLRKLPCNCFRLHKFAAMLCRVRMSVHMYVSLPCRCIHKHMHTECVNT